MEGYELFDFQVPYNTTPEMTANSLITMMRAGIDYNSFNQFAKKSPFSNTEWSIYLHLSERTLLRYRKEKRTFDALQSEKIIEIIILYKQGLALFGTEKKFNEWLCTDNLTLGKIKPKDLLDSTFGINLLKEELKRIEYGILA